MAGLALRTAAVAGLGALLLAQGGAEAADSAADRLTALREIHEAVQETLAFGAFCLDALEFDYTLESAQVASGDLLEAAGDPATLAALGKQGPKVLRAALKVDRRVAKTRSKVLFSGTNDDRRRKLAAKAVAKGASFTKALDRAALALGVAGPSSDVVVTEVTAPGAGHYTQGQGITIRVQVSADVLREGPIVVTSSYNRFRVMTDASVGSQVIAQDVSASAPLVRDFAFATAETRGVARFRVRPLLRAERMEVLFNSVDGTMPAIPE